MTEDEARTKTCCGAPLVALVIAAAVAKIPEEIRGAQAATPNCTGSACMAWRWWGRDQVMVQNVVGDRRAPFRGSRKQYADSPAWEITPVPDDGFCGLAGGQP